jgi:DNA-binding GntR family transcriptional regulator
MTQPPSSFDVLRSLTLSGFVQNEILRRIKSGELVAGAKLNEADLAEDLKISRSPVREAFRALEEAGLVKLEKNRGVFIRELSDREAVELYQVRSGLDEIAGRMLAPVITDAQLSELESTLTELETSASEGGVNRYFPLNIAFHDRVVEMTGNATLLTMYRQVVNRMHLLRLRGFSVAGSSQASHEEHRHILAALATREPDTAAKAMREHVMNGFHRAMAAHAESQAMAASAPASATSASE